MDTTRNISPSEIKGRLGSWRYVAQAIIDGLDGKPFAWCGGEFEAYRPKAKEMGVTLVTKTQIKRLGRELKRGVTPVGSGYFRAPISRSADLYILECQTKPQEPATETETETVSHWSDDNPRRWREDTLYGNCPVCGFALAFGDDEYYCPDCGEVREGVTNDSN